MTPQDLLELLPIVRDRGWRVNSEGYIRDRKGRCPICALANEIDPGVNQTFLANASFEEVMKSPLNGDLRFAIAELMDAADFPDRRLRGDMKLALGLDKHRAR